MHYQKIFMEAKIWFQIMLRCHLPDFVFQVAGEVEVKAQVRLKFQDVRGQRCLAVRSLTATQKV